MSYRIVDVFDHDDLGDGGSTGTATECHSHGFVALARRSLPVEPLVFAALFGSLTCASSYHPAEDFGTFSFTSERSLTAPLRSSNTKSAGADDALLESPNWLEGKLALLAARDFKRVNDPRARR